MPLLGFYLLSHILLSVETQIKSASSAQQPLKDLNPDVLFVYKNVP